MRFDRKSRWSRPVALAIAVASVLISGRADAVTRRFSKNSLIIPMSTSFQDACGLVSAYGLVYEMLAANATLNPPITVHWVYKAGKKSPNRCIPTNLSPTPQTPKTCVAPFTGGTCSPTPPIQDSTWNDGCDFSVTQNLVGPVTLIDNTTGNDVVGVFTTNDTTVDPLRSLAYPNFPSVAVQHTNSPATNVTTTQYSGGAFVIDAPDAPQFLSLLAGKTTASDRFGKALNFAAFRTAGTCGIAVNSGVAEFTTPMPAPNTNSYANVHYVNIHRAQGSFDAEDSQKISQMPGHIALLLTAGGQQGTSSAVNGIKSDMLPAYLASAGLADPAFPNFVNIAGCPPNGYNANNLALGNCPNGKQHGLIYDAFDVFDLQDSNIVARTGPLMESSLDAQGNPVFWYQNLWVPHWEGTKFTAGPRVCDDKCINAARTVAKTVSDYNHIGVLAECGSIGVLEGAADVTSQAGGGWWYPTQPGTGDPDGGYPDASISSPAGQYPAQIITCASLDGGSCTTGTPTASVRGIIHEVDPNSDIIGQLPLRNCTDPDLANGSNCVYYAAPGDPFAQVGDQLWFPRLGLVSDYKPYSGSAYKPEWNALAFMIPRLDQSKMGTYAQVRAQSASDFFSSDLRVGPSPDRSASTFTVYLGGHSYASDVAGTRVVLNTMLALGINRTAIETGFVGPTEYNGNLYVSTFYRNDTTANQAAPSEWYSFNPNLGSSFQFPYHLGAVRAHPESGSNQLATGANKYRDFVTNIAGQPYDTDKTMQTVAPGARNIFTYLGGEIIASPALGPGHSPVKGGLQLGWTPVDIDYPSVDMSKSCLDKFRIGEVNSTTRPTYTGAAYAGMLTAPDGVCDLQEALEFTAVPLGSDHGASEGVMGGPIPKALLNDVTNAQELLQLVRGYCYITSTGSDGLGTLVPHPTDATKCNFNFNNKGNLQDNSAVLGGVWHSQPAIVQASPLVKDNAAGGHRPSVLYVGALDGMLHAFYVPSDGKDANYQGAASTLIPLNPDASKAFVGHTPFTSGFSPPAPMTELWAFIPPGQLPLLKSNNARVDSSPAVIDVFGDFAATGLREWHTVLVASAGGSNRELFALDISNPLKPVLLWDIQSSFDNRPPSSMQYAPVVLANDDIGLDKTTTAQAFLWQNKCHTGATGCTPATFSLPPQVDPGLSVTGLYNYLHLGASNSISAAPMRRNNAPVFAAFVGTNEPEDLANSGMGLYTFAIDLVTGQKIWEFSNPYTPSSYPLPARQSAAVGNTPPAGVTLLSKAANSIIDTLYVGDEEGSLWELDAADGVNLTSYASQGLTGCAAGACNFSLSQAYGDGTNSGQPISTLSTIFIVPSNYPANGQLAAYTNQALLAYGTGGTDVISGLEPANADCSGGKCINGFLHLLPIAPTGRNLPGAIAGNTTLQAQVQQKGVAKPVTGYPLALPAGERLFGSIVVAGTNFFFATSGGAGASLDALGNQTGATYNLNLGGVYNATPFPGARLAGTSIGGAGGTPAVYTDLAGNKKVATVTDQGIAVAALPPQINLAGPSVNGRGQTPSTLLGWFFRRRGSEF